MSVCWHHGWSVERDFDTLSVQEQNNWIAWEYQRQQHINEAVEAAYEKGEDGKVSADLVTARVLAERLRLDI